MIQQAKPPKILSGQQQGALWLDAAVTLGRAQMQALGDQVRQFALKFAIGSAAAVAAAPRDYRPVVIEAGLDCLAGDFVLPGGSLAVGPDGNPWIMASPNRQFAAALHGFSWLDALVAQKQPGCLRALQLVLDWQNEFGRGNWFSWQRDILESRVFHLACNLRTLVSVASELEAKRLCLTLAQQAAYLLAEPNPRRSERAAVSAIAASALSGRACQNLLNRALFQLKKTLPVTVLTDGVHANRSPEATMELLFILLTLDDGLVQRGIAAPLGLAGAIDRITSAMRFFTMPDGRLPSYHGGEEGLASRVAAARAHDDQDLNAKVPQQARYGGYQRLQGKSLTVIMDVGAPASGIFGNQACAQPLALEITCGRDRLVTSCGWSPRLAGLADYRLTAAGSTVSLEQGSVGQPLEGRLAKILGPRLVGGADKVQCRRRESETDLLLEATHNGWMRRFGLMHQRRLFMDTQLDELRGEDSFIAPPKPKTAPRPGRGLRFEVFFHLHPLVRASLAQDRRSVLLMTANDGGWRLRTDAAVVTVDQGLHFVDGLPRRTQKIILRDSLARQGGGQIRWKLTRADVRA